MYLTDSMQGHAQLVIYLDAVYRARTSMRTLKELFQRSAKDSYSFRYNIIGTRKRHPEEVEPLRKISICFVALPFTYLMGVESKALISSNCKRLGRHNHDTVFEGLLE